jgi:peroxiredoxin
MKKTIFTMLVLLAVSTVVLSGCKSKEPEREPDPEPNETPEVKPVVKPAAGKTAPAFTLNSFDGKAISLSGYKGKIVVLEWVNPECPYVRYHYEKKNTMIELAAKYKADDVVWLAVNSTSHFTAAKDKEFAEKHNLDYPVLSDSSGVVGKAYGAKTTPHIFIIDSKGNIAYDGGIDNAPLGIPPAGKAAINYVDKALTELIGGNAVSTPKATPYGCSVKYAN